MMGEINRKTCIVLLIFAVFFTFRNSLPAEIIYLNNGSVVRGAIIKEGKKSITVKNETGEIEIEHVSIKRIMYGNMDMEKVYILMLNGKIIKGFMVDQDDEKIIIRENSNLPDEKAVLKKDIREISRDNIYPVDLELFVKPSLFIPLDAGGANLKPSVLYALGIAFNSMIVPNMRILFESGYVSCKSSDNSSRTLQVIPITLSSIYKMGFWKFNFLPKLGAGVGIMEFDTAENKVMKTNAFEGIAGAGILYEIRKRINLGLWAEYIIFYDGSDYLQNALIGISCSYRL